MGIEFDIEQWHTIHPYFAKFSPSVPELYVQKHTAKGDLVLDPFSGSGTTAMVCSVQGRDFIGVDANPIAALLSRVKSSIISNEAVHYCELLLNRRSEIESSAPANYPEIPNREKWFTENMLLELAKIKKVIFDSPEETHDILSLAFSRIIVRCSNQHGESRYVSVEKNHYDGKAYDLFFSTLENVISLYRQYLGARSNSDCRIFCEDLRSIDFSKFAGQVSLAVTSPPYLNSWDYSLYHRFRYFWLDLPLKPFANVEIGQHLKGQRMKDGQMVEEYTNDMKSCLKNVFIALSPGAHFVILNAPAIVKKKRVDSSQIIIDEAVAIGYEHLETLDDKIFGPHHGNRANLQEKGIVLQEEKKKTEQTIILRKPF
jgi:hypothetical protein